MLLRTVVAAVTFLTRVPVGRFVRIGPEDVARSAWLFPAVGGAVGAVCGLLADVAADWLPSLAAGALAVGAAALLTGAMHLDALADTADALGGSTRERSLEIMRDHAVGAFGATALIVVCVLDAAILGALAETDDAALVGLAAGAVDEPRAASALRRSPTPVPLRGQGRVLAGMGLATVVLGLLSPVCWRCQPVRPGCGQPARRLWLRRGPGRSSHGTGSAVSPATCSVRRPKLAETAALVAAPPWSLADMELVLVRHAEPTDNARGRCYGRLDVELSEAGREQCTTTRGPPGRYPVAAVV